MDELDVMGYITEKMEGDVEEAQRWATLQVHRCACQSQRMLRLVSTTSGGYSVWIGGYLFFPLSDKTHSSCSAHV